MGPPRHGSRRAAVAEDDCRAALDRLDAELAAALMRELLHTWRGLNQGLLRGALRPPIIRLTDATRLLGRWDPARRTIELSAQLVLEGPWGSVVEVLKHEMAHQYVHEVLEVVDEPAHGTAFRSLCERLGTDPAASGSPPCARGDDDPGRARVLRRVAGLLALAESSNRHEAETAAAVAQRLMLKHNIECSERPGGQRYDFRHLGRPTGRVPEWEHILASLLPEHFFVEAIWVPAYRPHDGKRGSVLEISGNPDNLEMAAYAHAFLSGTAERLWAQHKRETGLRSNRDRRTFYAGVMEGFRDRLVSEKSRNEERGLVWVGDADLRTYHRQRHPHIRHVRLRGHARNAARSEGRAAGRRIVLHRGMSAGGEGAAGAPAGRLGPGPTRKR